MQEGDGLMIECENIQTHGGSKVGEEEMDNLNSSFGNGLS